MLGLSRLQEFIHRVRGRKVQLDLRRYERILRRIDERTADLTQAPDGELLTLSTHLRELARGGADLDDLVPEAYALVREAGHRTIGLRHFDVQMIAGLALYRGKLAEMRTGEGKTLAAVAPAYMHALTRGGVHVLTFNDYLARRDAEWMEPIYRFLGMSVGFVQQNMSTQERQSAYRSDVTYVTATEAGFDFLRDHLCTEPEELVHRPFHFAIIDEADSILIDEARVPLVVAGSATQPPRSAHEVAEIVRRLRPEIDYDTDEYKRNVNLTEAGVALVESRLGCGNLHDPVNLRLLTELNLALHAEVLLKRDWDYIVRDGEVRIVDELTGRVAAGRRWPYGLHTAVEAKEGLELQDEGEIRGSIALQHFLTLYPRISAMTATAQPAAEELNEFYGLEVVVIPPNRPCVRVDHPDIVFSHTEAKETALIGEIAGVHATRRPVLVGTASVEESERLAAALLRMGIPCSVLNARNDAAEAKIIAQAGALGAITISTNMAGRGVDIRLGGDAGQDRADVVALGGLYVICTHRHESRRLDDQMRGRAGRQGDPGESRFFVSLEDELIARHGVQELIPARHRPSRQARSVDDPVLRREIDRAQRIVDGQNREIRRTLRRYSSLIEEQRRIVHLRRQAVLREEVSLSLLEMRSPDRLAALRSIVTEQTLQRVEKQLTLFHIDEAWTGHLARVAHVRDGIHLFSLGGLSPLEEFHMAIAKMFQGLLEEIDTEIIKTFERTEITEAGINLERAGLRGPGSTWTYLVSDNPFGSWLDRASKFLRAKLGKTQPGRPSDSASG